MSPDEQRLKIAEVCGWKKPSDEKIGVIDPDGHWRTKAEVNSTYEETLTHFCPDYLSDLNACHEMEMIVRISGPGSGIYREHLKNVCSSQDPIFATAAQRCEAFLRTLSIWTD